jgi:hypothetical protein
LTANFGNGGNDLVQHPIRLLHRDQFSEIEIAGILVQHAVALAQDQPLLAQVRCFRTVGLGFDAWLLGCLFRIGTAAASPPAGM